MQNSDLKLIEKIANRVRSHKLLAYGAFIAVLPTLYLSIFFLATSEDQIERNFEKLYQDLNAIVESKKQQLETVGPLAHLLNDSEPRSPQLMDLTMHRILKAEEDIETLQGGLNQFSAGVSDLVNESGWSRVVSLTISNLTSVIVIFFSVGILLNFYRHQIAMANKESAKLDLLDYAHEQEISSELFAKLLIESSSSDTEFNVSKNPSESALKLIEKILSKS